MVGTFLIWSFGFWVVLVTWRLGGFVTSGLLGVPGFLMFLVFIGFVCFGILGFWIVADFGLELSLLILWV